MKKLMVILAIVLLPAAAWGWRDGYDSDRYYNDLDRNYQLEKIADELRYQQEYREYQDQVEAYEEGYPEEIQQFMLKHYYKWPQPTKALVRMGSGLNYCNWGQTSFIFGVTDTAQRTLFS